MQQYKNCWSRRVKRKQAINSSRTTCYSHVPPTYAIVSVNQAHSSTSVHIHPPPHNTQISWLGSVRLRLWDGGCEYHLLPPWMRGPVLFLTDAYRRSEAICFFHRYSSSSSLKAEVARIEHCCQIFISIANIDGFNRKLATQ
jgi:hypothetical protein